MPRLSTNIWTGAQPDQNNLTWFSAPGYLTPLLIGLSGQAIVSLIALTPPVLAVVAAPDLDIRVSDVGLFSSLLFLSAMASASMGGTFVRRYGALRVTQLCLLSSATGIALAATAIVPLAALGACFVGLGYGPMTPAGSHLLAKVTSPQSRALVFSIKQTSIPIGGVLAGMLIPILVEISTWQWAMMVTACLGSGCAIILQPFRKYYDSDRKPEAQLELHLVRLLVNGLKQTKLRRLCLATMGYSGTQVCFNAFFVIFLVERAALSLAEAGVVFTIAQLSGIVGRVVWGLVAQHWISSQLLLVMLGLIMATSSLITGWVDTNWSMMPLMVLGGCFGAAASGWNGLYLAEIVHITSVDEAATATGVSLFFTFGGMMIAPAIFSAAVFLTDSYAAAFSFLALAMIPSIILMAPGYWFGNR